MNPLLYQLSYAAVGEAIIAMAKATCKGFYMRKLCFLIEILPVGGFEPSLGNGKPRPDSLRHQYYNCVNPTAE